MVLSASLAPHQARSTLNREVLFRRLKHLRNLRPANKPARTSLSYSAAFERHLSRFNRLIIAIRLLQQPFAARWQIKRQPRFAELNPLHIDHIDIREITGFQHAAIIEAV